MKSLSEFINESLILEGDMSKHIPMLLDVFSGKEASGEYKPMHGNSGNVIGFEIPRSVSNRYRNRRRLMKLLTSYKQINNPTSFNFKEGNIYLLVGGYNITGDASMKASPVDTGVIALGKEGETIYVLADAWTKGASFLNIGADGKSTMETSNASWKKIVATWDKIAEKFKKEHPNGITVDAKKVIFRDEEYDSGGFTQNFEYKVYELPEKYSEFLDALANLK